VAPGGPVSRNTDVVLLGLLTAILKVTFQLPLCIVSFAAEVALYFEHRPTEQRVDPATLGLGVNGEYLFATDLKLEDDVPGFAP
jgi:hypothetical protein